MLAFFASKGMDVYIYMPQQYTHNLNYVTIKRSNDVIMKKHSSFVCTRGKLNESQYKETMAITLIQKMIEKNDRLID